MDQTDQYKIAKHNTIENKFDVNNLLNNGYNEKILQNSNGDLKQHQNENPNQEEDIKSLQHKIESLQSKINTQNTEKNDLQEIIQTLEHELHKYKESDFSPIKSRYNSPQKPQKQEDVSEELLNYQKTVLELTQNLSIKTQELAIYQQIIEDNSNKLKDLQYENQELLQKSPTKSYLSSPKSPDKDEIEMVKRQYQIINQERHQLEDSMVQLQSSNKILGKENEELVCINRKLDKEMQELKQITIFELESDLQATQNKLKVLSQSTNSKQYLERIEQLAFDKQNLQRKCDELYEDLEELQNNQQEQYYNQKQQFMQENSALQTQLREVQLISEKEKASSEHSQKQLEHKEKRLGVLEKELEGLKNSQKNLEGAKEGFEKQCNQLQKQVYQQEEQVDQKEKKQEKMQQQIQNLIKTIQKYDKQFSYNQDSSLSTIQEENIEQIEANQILVEKQKNEILELQEQLEQYKNEIHLRSMKYDEIQGILDHISEVFKDQLNEKERLINEKQRQLNELTDKLKIQESQITNFQQQILEKKTLDLAQTTRYDQEKTMQGISELEQLLTYRDEQIKKLQVQILKYEEEKFQTDQGGQMESKYKYALQKKQEELELVLSDIQQLQEEKKNISSFIDKKYQIKYQQMEQEYHQQLSSYKNDNSVLQSKQQELQKEIDMLHDQLQNGQKQQLDNQDNSGLEARLQEQYEENQQLIQEFNQEQKNHNNEINRLNQEIYVKINEIKVLEQQLKKNLVNEQLEEFNIINKQLQEELLFINKKYKEQYQENQQLQYSLTNAQSENKSFKDKEQTQQSNSQQKLNQLIQDLNKQGDIIEQMQQEKKIMQNEQQQSKKDTQFLENAKHEIKIKEKQQQKEKEEFLLLIRNKDADLKRMQQMIETLNSAKKILDDNQQSQDLKIEQKQILKFKQLNLDQNKDIIPIKNIVQEDTLKKIQIAIDREPKEIYRETSVSPVKIIKKDERRVQTRESENLKTEEINTDTQYDTFYQNQALEQMYSKCIQRSKNLLNKNEVLLNTLKQTHLNNQFMKISPEKIQEKCNKYEQTANQYQNYLNKDKYELDNERSSVSSMSQVVSDLDKSAYKHRSYSQSIAQMEVLKEPQQSEIYLKNNHQTPLRYQPAKQQTVVQGGMKDEQLGKKSEESRYEGEKAGQQRHGRGRMWYPNDEVYEGEWKGDKVTLLIYITKQRSGYGIQKDNSSQEIYNGDWSNDMYHGQGRLRNKNIVNFNSEFDFRNFDRLCNFWVNFSGEFKNNTPHGLGTLILSNGEKFLGSFLAGKVHGEGTFYRLNGEIQVGFWQNNKFVGNL